MYTISKWFGLEPEESSDEVYARITRKSRLEKEKKRVKEEEEKRKREASPGYKARKLKKRAHAEKTREKLVMAAVEMSIKRRKKQK